MYGVKSERPAPLLAGNYSEDALTKAINDNVKSYNKFLLAQVFQAAAPENVSKVLSHKDQTCLTVDDAYQTFFTEHRVESDKKQTMVNKVNSVSDDQDNSAPDHDMLHSGHNNSDPSKGINNKDPIIEAINPRGNSTTKAL